MGGRTAKVLVLGMLWAAGSSSAALPDSPDQVPVAEDVVLRGWSLQDGMPDHHVGSITRSADGYLWVTCFSGLLRFDGDRFVLMGKSSIPGLESRWVLPAHAAGDGVLWLGLDRGGIARWKDGTARMIRPLQPRPNRTPWPSRFAEDPAGGIWFSYSHESTVYRWHEERLVTHGPEKGIPQGTWAQVHAAKDGAIWLATGKGCFRFNGERFDEVDPAGGAGPRLAAATDGGMWAIRGGRLLKYGDDGNKTDVGGTGWLGGSHTDWLLAGRDGSLWIGSWGAGLFRYRDGDFAKVPTSNEHISALAEDEQGNLWVGTWGGGLDRVTPRSFFLRPGGQGAGEASIRGVCLDAAGKVWWIDHAGRPMVEADDGGKSFKQVDGWDPARGANCVRADPAGSVWFGTTGGLVRWQDGRFQREDFDRRIESLFFDRDGDLWIATSGGPVFRRRGKEAVATDGGLVDARAISQDAAGRMWIGTSDGSLFVRRSDAFERVDLPDAGGDETIRFIVPESDGTVWIGSLVGGLYRWRDGEVKRVPDDAGLPLAEARSLVIEPRGISAEDVFWLGTANGLYRTTRSEIEAALTGPRREIRVIRHGVDDGLPSLDFAPAFAGGATATRDGRLWFATNLGALEIDAAGVRSAPVVGKVIIEEARIGGELQPAAAAWRIPPNAGPLEIRYTFPELRQPAHTRFRYRLRDSDDTAWTEAGDRREVTFARLAPGDYRFEVTASVAGGPWLSEAAAVDFSVLPAWWQTLWFRAGAALLLGAAVWRAVALRVRARIRRLEQERALERERARIARDMHDEVGANLTHIAATSRLAMLTAPEEIPEHLEEIAATARQTIDSLDEIVWAVNPRYDTLAGSIEYLGKFAVRFVSSAGLECEVDLPGELPPVVLTSDVRHHLLLVVKEALNNAVKHARARKVRVAAALEGNSLRLTVADDGAGFDPAARDEAGADGLRNMRERMAGIGGTLEIQSAPGKGTGVTLMLPFSAAPTERLSSPRGGLS